MKRRFLLFALILAISQTFLLTAQTDVTDTYLTNASFDTNCNYTYDATAENLGTSTDGSTLLTVSNWTSNYSGWSAGGTFEYGYTGQLNTESIPATGSDGITTGSGNGCLGVCAAWTGNVFYSQSITLPAGTYTLNYKVINNGTSTGGTSLAGFVVDGTTQYLSSLSNIGIATDLVAASEDPWVSDEVTFVLTTETTGQIQIGIQAANAGSGGNGRFFFDDIQLLVTQEVDKTSLQSLVDDASTMYSTQEAVPDGSTVYSELNTAIAAAQTVLDNTSATLAEVAEQEDAIELAINNVNNAIELQQRITTWTTLPYDATSAIVNPSFETGNSEGWVNDGGFWGQNNTSFTLKDGSYYVEKWQSAGNSWSGFKLYQTIENIPNGVYRLSAAALNNPESTGGAFIYANDVSSEVVSTNEYTVEVLVTDNTLEIGYDIVNAGNYIAVDNFRLSYIADESPVIILQNEYLLLDENINTATFKVSGYNLTDDITITPPTGFSTDVTSLSYDAISETVTVTFDASAEVSDNITLTSGTATVSLPVYGRLNSTLYTPYFSDKTNLANDAYCADRALYAGWGTVTTTNDPTEVYCGSKSIKIGSTGTGCDAAFDINPFTFNANSAYRIRAMLKTVGGSLGVFASGSDPNYNNAFDTGGDWQQIDFFFATGASASSGFITFNKCDNGSDCSVAYIDNYEIYEVSNDATLSEISYSAGTLSPVFSPDVTTYELIVPEGTSTVDISGTTNDENASIEGEEIITLVNGEGTATLTVTAESGNTIDYLITISSISRDATLSTISFDNETYLEPAFDPETYEYTAIAPNGATSVTITPTTTSSVAQSTGAVTLDLQSGSASTTITVTAEDTDFTNDYVLNVVVDDHSCLDPLFTDGRNNIISEPYLSSLDAFGGWGNRGLNYDQNFVFCGAVSGIVWGNNGGSIDYNLAGLLKASTSYMVKAMIYVDTEGQFQIGVDNVTSSPIETRTTTTNQWEAISFVFTTADNYGDNGLMYFNNYGIGGNVGYIDNWEIYEVSSDATLSAINIDGSLINGFDSGTTTYNIDVPANTESSVITASASDANSTVTITNNGNIDLTSGSGTATITVTAESGDEVTYTININVLSDDATLSAIKIDGSLITGFDASTTTYNVNVAANTASVSVTATTNDALASVAITNDGTIDVTSGSGTATITVTAEDGTESTYTVNITVLSNDATLSAINIDGSPITDFDAATTTYDVTVAAGTSGVTVSASANDPKSGLAITDNGTIDLTSGSATVEITVTAEDGTEITYTINITVQVLSDDATLSAINIDGDLITGFDANTTSYNITVAAGTTSATITASTNDSNASLVIANNGVVDLTSGSGTATITVTAEDATELTYTVNIIVLSDNATLSDIKIDGTSIVDFDPATINYNVSVAAGTTSVFVSASANDVNATVTITNNGTIDVSSGSATVEITVTAQDASSMTYTVNIRVLSNIATLSAININGSLINGFDAATTTYNVTVAANTTNVSVTATSSDALASVAITNEGTIDVTSGSATATITVTAEDGTEMIYTVNITVLSDDATLSAINLDGALINGFDATTTTYNVTVAANTTSVSITATASDALASVAITNDGNIDVTSGSATATITVTAEDGTEMIYTVNITVLSDDATLSAINLDGALINGFDATTTTYNVTVAANTTSVSITATASDALASVAITNNGNIDMTSGSATATITVTAEDGTEMTYTVNITVEVLSDDATLSAINLDGALINGFDAAITTYNVTVAANTTSVSITATASDALASVAITNNGNIDVTSGSATATITVTAEDGTEMTYTVNITVEVLSDDATLSAINLDGALINGFDAATTTYNVTAAANTTSVSITATASDALASVAITNNGNIDVTSGSATATITVTAEDGTEMTYTVNITVDSATDIFKKDKVPVKIYPTVTNSTIFVEFPSKPGIIKVYSLSGQLVKTIQAQSQTESIDLSTSGIYLIHVVSEGKTTISKVIKK